MRCVKTTYHKKVTKLLKYGSVSGGAVSIKVMNESVKSHLRENLHYRRALSEKGLMPGVIDERLFGYVQCDIEVREHLRNCFSNFPPIFKNIGMILVI